MINYFKNKREHKLKLDVLKTSVQPMFAHMLMLENRILFKKFLGSFKLRGFLFGWFQTSLECSKLDIQDEQFFIDMMVSCHHALLGDYDINAWTYFENSVANQCNKDFVQYSKIGHIDFIDFINPESDRDLITLLKIYNEVEDLYNNE